MHLIRFFSLFPLWLLYPFAELLAFFSYHILRYRKEVIRENLTHAFPEKSKSQIRRLAKNFHRSFWRVFVESVRAYRFRKKDWIRHVPIKNPELLLKFLDQGTPVIILSGHTANWEWPAFSIGQQLGYPMEFLYKPIKNKRVDRIIRLLREKHGGIPVPKDQAMREIIKRRKQTRIIGIIGDQLPSIGTEKKWLNFLNHETAFYIGAERIATMAQYAVFYVDTKRMGIGKYEVTFKPVASPPYKDRKIDITERYVDLLEQTIQHNPPGYLWSHKRWKYTKEEEEAMLSS